MVIELSFPINESIVSKGTRQKVSN